MQKKESAEMNLIEKLGEYKLRSGYILEYWLTKDGRDLKTKLIYQHRRIIEEYFGEIPDRWEVHHANNIKSDNRLVNLIPIPKQVHRRLHKNGN